ncbi:CatB-related O-acetyltransferase [Cohaesibacter marisflavi]|uniref:CatB-related O-acetyltransferase n=1 Tax=Cohaesibacter marisflavi TaxID=655353 RepID=UPI0029C8C172|nr:CatB-related O-acetyltransferase [Cohaesibacter marisflavi]
MFNAELIEKVRSFPQVHSVRPDFLSLYMTQDVVDLFKSMNIYFGRKDNRFRPNQRVHFKDFLKVEPYACFPQATWLHDMGSFSYSETNLPNIANIGRYCSIAIGLSFFGVRHPMEWVTTSSILYDVKEADGYRSFLESRRRFACDDLEVVWPDDLDPPAPVIEHDVWIGKDATLARNITIGTGSIVGANAVVTKDVPPYAIVAGNPAKILRYRFSEDVIERLLKSQWWRYSPEIFKLGDFRCPEEFLDAFESQERPEVYSPELITGDDLFNAVYNRFC